jgi:hypothetical protein
MQSGQMKIKDKNSVMFYENKDGRIALCYSCVYDGFCHAKMKYYKCKNYIKNEHDQIEKS